MIKSKKKNGVFADSAKYFSRHKSLARDVSFYRRTLNTGILATVVSCSSELLLLIKLNLSTYTLVIVIDFFLAITTYLWIYLVEYYVGKEILKRHNWMKKTNELLA